MREFKRHVIAKGGISGGVTIEKFSKNSTGEPCFDMFTTKGYFVKRSPDLEFLKSMPCFTGKPKTIKTERGNEELKEM